MFQKGVDLNGDDNMIDPIDNLSEVEDLKDKIHVNMESFIKDRYTNIFSHDVDFHHKSFYRFEKAYRLGKKQPHKKEALNKEIIDLISENSNYIEFDRMALFYCLYFCIFFKNPDIVEFLRALINKFPNLPDKIK